MMPRPPQLLPDRSWARVAEGRRMDPLASAVPGWTQSSEPALVPAPSPPHFAGPRAKRGGGAPKGRPPPPISGKGGRERLGSDLSALSPPETRERKKIGAFPGGAGGRGDARARRKEGTGSCA